MQRAARLTWNAVWLGWVSPTEFGDSDEKEAVEAERKKLEQQELDAERRMHEENTEEADGDTEDKEDTDKRRRRRRTRRRCRRGRRSRGQVYGDCSSSSPGIPRHAVSSLF